MSDARAQIVRINYALLLLGLLSGGITAVVAVVIAHMQASQSDWPYREHFRFQYRTFWIGLLYYLIAGITTLAMIGWFLLLLIFIWWVVRCVRGLASLSSEKPPARLVSWGF